VRFVLIPMIEKRKTTQDFKKEFLEYKSSFVDFNASVIDFMLNPYPLDTPAQRCLGVAAKFAVPEKQWMTQDSEPQYSWIMVTLISDEDKDFLRDSYYRDFQLREYRLKITQKMLEVLDCLETKPYKLSAERILLRVCGYITDIDISHFDKYQFSPLRKIDVKDIILQLITHQLIPDIYIDAVKVLVEEIYEVYRNPVTAAPPLLAVGDLNVVAELVEVNYEKIAYPMQVGTYESSMAEIAENVALQDDLGRPVVVEAVFFEMEAVPEFPGMLTPQVSYKLDTLDGLPQLPERIQNRMRILGRLHNNCNVVKISSVLVGDDDTYEYFEERSIFSLQLSNSSQDVPYKSMSDLYDWKCDLISKHKDGLFLDSVRKYVDLYKQRLRKEELKLAKDYYNEPEYRYRNTNRDDDGFGSKRQKYKDKDK